MSRLDEENLGPEDWLDVAADPAIEVQGTLPIIPIHGSMLALCTGSLAVRRGLARASFEAAFCSLLLRLGYFGRRNRLLPLHSRIRSGRAKELVNFTDPVADLVLQLHCAKV